MDIKLKIKIQRRLLKSVTKIDNGCWIWSKKKRKYGYANVHINLGHGPRIIGAHRLSYIVFRNRPDLLENKNIFVCHKCDNKDCLNPEHLFAGDWLENAMDDVLRNPNVSREFMYKITQMYREKHSIPKNVRIWTLVQSK